MKELILKKKVDNSNTRSSYEINLLDDDGLVVETYEFEEGWRYTIQTAKDEVIK